MPSQGSEKIIGGKQTLTRNTLEYTELIRNAALRREPIQVRDLAMRFSCFPRKLMNIYDRMQQ